MNKEEIKKTYIVDADGKILGRISTFIADVLRGKKKTNFAPNKDVGDNVVVINAKKVKVTGKKMTDKIYYRHSGYPGGIKSTTLEEMLIKKPEEVIRHSVKSMLPKNKLQNIFIKKLDIYADDSYKVKEGDIKL